MPTLTISGRTIQVDPIDADLLEINWFISSTGYATQGGDYLDHRLTNRRMHRDIMQRVVKRRLARWELVDHINGDKLDNRRANLRICNNSENGHNRDQSVNNTTGYKGVYRNTNCSTWQAIITVNYKRHYLGSYRTAEEAARAYDRAARAMMGPVRTGNLQ